MAAGVFQRPPARVKHAPRRKQKNGPNFRGGVPGSFLAAREQLRDDSPASELSRENHETTLGGGVLRASGAGLQERLRRSSRPLGGMHGARGAGSRDGSRQLLGQERVRRGMRQG